MKNLRWMPPMFIFLIFTAACSTTSMNVEVQRAPTFLLEKMGKVAYEIKAVDGIITWERSQDCQYAQKGGSRKGNEGKIPQDRIDRYQKSLAGSLRSALSSPKIQIVDKEQADVLVSVSALFNETKVAESRRCTTSAYLSCLPDTKEGCGCAAARDGKLDVNAYDWYVNITGTVYVSGVVEVTRGSELVGKSEFMAIAATGPGIGGATWCFVHGSPDIVDRCFEVSVNNKVTERTVNYEEFWRAEAVNTFKNATERLRKMFVPYRESIELAIFKLSEPDGADDAVDAMKENQWDKARLFFEKNLDAVRKSQKMDPEDISHFLYDYALVLMHSAEFAKAEELLNEAMTLAKEDEYQTALKECQRQKADTEALGEKKETTSDSGNVEEGTP